MMSSGPGGLTGGSFLSGTNDSRLMGTDYSKQISAQGFGEMSSASTNQDRENGGGSRFDTSAYEYMLKDMFNTDNVGQELTNMGNPFDGNSYDLPTNKNTDNGQGYETSKEASMGSYASTDMSKYGDTSGAGDSGVQTHSTGYGNAKTDSSNPSGTDTNSAGQYQSPFNIDNYDKNSPPSSSGYGNNVNNVKGPFDTSSFNNAKNPFSVNRNSGAMNMGSQYAINSPFTVNGAYNNNGPFSIDAVGNRPGYGGNVPYGNTAQGPFDTSKFSSMGGVTGQGPFNVNQGTNVAQIPFNTGSYETNGLSGQMIQNGGSTARYTETTGLDQYGNVDFGTITGLSGKGEGGNIAGMGMKDYSTGSSTYSGGSNAYLDTSSGSGKYNSYSGSHNNGQYTGNGAFSSSPYDASASTYKTTGYVGVSESQYKTPFESDNYNSMLENPFDSKSYFDSNVQNFKTPYEKTDAASQAGTGPYQEHIQYNGAGPAGDPFNQGGQSKNIM